MALCLLCAVSFSLLNGLCAAQVRPAIVPFKVPEDLSEGNRLSVMCAVTSGSPPISFVWHKDGKPIGDLPGVRIAHMDDFQDVLQIERLTADHAGNYTCNAKNMYGADHISVPVMLKFAPRWLRSDSGTLNAAPGEPLVIDCAVVGHPTPTLRVFHSEQEIVPDSRFSFSRGNVNLESVTMNDRGDYRCEVENPLGKITKNVSVILSVPARFKEKASVVTSRRSDTTTLKCYAVGDNPISVVWSKGNVKLDKRTSSRYEIIESMTTDGMSSELRIRETDRADSALYTCHTENKYGTDDRKVKLVVKDVPGAPQDVKVKDIWSRSVSLHWTPSYDGNSPITKFIVTYWRDQGLNFRQQELEVSSAQHFTLVRDLQPGTHYVLNVVAENVIGKSEASRTVTFTTNEEEPKCI